MKVETRERSMIVAPYTVYIADDGKEFEKKRDCENYEWEKFKKPLLDKLHRAEKAEGFPNIGDAYNSDDHDYTWYKIETQEDADIIKEVYDIAVDVGKWICVEDAYDDIYITTLDDGIEYATKLFDALGYEFELREKTEEPAESEGENA